VATWGSQHGPNGKVAIITGGAHGMGDAEARLFAQEGANVVIADVLVREGEAVAADIAAGQRQARFVRTDVTSEADWKKLIAEAIAAYGRLDILVNNAGISGSSVGEPDGLEGWQRLLAVNATSVFLGTKLAAAEMANRRRLHRQHLVHQGHRRQRGEPSRLSRLQAAVRTLTRPPAATGRRVRVTRCIRATCRRC
jgi:NAD(P)-dependent dehydrogenase (short-subunit alcohol dehydrogenase family)